MCWLPDVGITLRGGVGFGGSLVEAVRFFVDDAFSRSQSTPLRSLLKTLSGAISVSRGQRLTKYDATTFLQLSSVSRGLDRCW
jgi:hypothetical protein